jgi:hypothetical protein
MPNGASTRDDSLKNSPATQIIRIRENSLDFVIHFEKHYMHFSSEGTIPPQIQHESTTRPGTISILYTPIRRLSRQSWDFGLNLS